MIILLSGDIATNPGPIRFPCGSCAKPVRSNQHGLQCNDCNIWTHRTCLSMNKDEYMRLSNSDEYWFCYKCILPNFTDSFFNASNLSDISISSDSSSVRADNTKPLSPLLSPGFLIQPENINQSTTNSVCEEACDIFKDLRETRKGNLKRPILCHLNINSLRHKFNDLKPILMEKLCDILIVSETKLDDTYNDNLFHVNGYKMERKDRNAKGGGLMAFYRSDLPVRRLKQYECLQSENIFLELKLKNRSWGICIYRPPSMNDGVFDNDLCSKLDQILIKFDHMCIVGDLNYNLLVSEKSHTLRNIIDTYSLKNLVKDPTCHTKIGNPSLLDVLLTNSPSLMCNSINFDCGLSDCHNMIAACFKEQCITNKRHKVTFRSYKTFDEAVFTQDLHQVPFQVATLFVDADDCYWAYETLLADIVDEHAPKKQKYPKKDSPPFMNTELRKAIYK